MNGVSCVEKYFEFDPMQRNYFASLQGIYADWNAKINVISRKDFDNFYERHVLHSLAILKTGLIKDGDTVLDLGCGGGFPVVPLAIALRGVNFIAVDSVGKKIAVVEGVASLLGLGNVTSRNCRVESLGLQYDWVVSRAVAPIGELVAWTKGSCRKGLILLKGGDLAAEIAASGVKPSKIRVEAISQWFGEEFFETKSVVIIRI